MSYLPEVVVEVSLVEHLEEWERLAPEWSALCDRVPDASPFQRPEWLLPWWRCFGSGRLFVLAFRSHHRLTALAPFFIHPWHGRRQVTLVGTGLSDYLGLLADPDSSSESARHVFECLAAHRDQWDFCDWQDLASPSPLRRLSPRSQPCDPCLRAPLVPRRPLPHGLAANLRQARRRLERLGELVTETLTTAADTTVLEIVRLHTARWSAAGGPGSTLDTPAAQRLLIAAGRAFAETGRLRLYTLRLRGELIAGIYAFLDAGVAWGYMTGFHPDLARYSPGSVLLEYALNEAAREGAAAWDFLRGREPYKERWGAVQVPKSRICFTPVEREHDEPAVA